MDIPAEDNGRRRTRIVFLLTATVILGSALSLGLSCGSVTDAGDAPAPGHPTPIEPLTAGIDRDLEGTSREAVPAGGETEPGVLPGILEVGALLRRPNEELLTELDLSPRSRAVLATPQGRTIAEAEIRAARARLDELFRAHSAVSLPAARRLEAEGRGRRSPPPAGDEGSYSRVWCSDGWELWVSREDAPELFAIKDSMLLRGEPTGTIEPFPLHVPCHGRAATAGDGP